MYSLDLNTNHGDAILFDMTQQQKEEPPYSWEDNWNPPRDYLSPLRRIE